MGFSQSSDHFLCDFHGFCVIILILKSEQDRTENGYSNQDYGGTKMTQSTSKTKTQTDVKRAVPQLRLPDSENTAQIIMDQMLDFCARKMGRVGRLPVVDLLRQGNRDAYKYCRYSIAKQVAESLGVLDRTIKSVYVIEYDATPEDMCFGKGAPTSLIHLIVWTDRKTKALDSLVSALDRALVQRFVEVVATDRLAHLLDVQAVNDEDVENHVGYGAMLSSLHNRPIRIWER
jgi:hypothetical protein